MKNDFLKIYSTWGFHDELGDKTVISEDLVHTALNTLEDWKRTHDVSFDIFHFDAFWFDRSRPYTAFHPENFPNGHEAIFARIKSLGMKPGLWYSTNAHMMDVPEWADAKAANEPCHSFLDGRYAELFEEALFLAAEQWGVRYYKFDFTTFRATVDLDRPRHVNYREGQKRFKEILWRLRKGFPDIHIIAHTGIARGEQSTVSGHTYPITVDPAWLEAFDLMFPGDPHPIDIPQTALVRNLDIFQDRQTWALHQNGYPLERIDDHGVLIGPTDTCCYRGRAGFKRTCLGQLMRGANRHLLYGNPTVLNESDVLFMREAVALIKEAKGRGLGRSFLGSGEPGMHPWHGYAIGGGSAGLFYLVNPTFCKQQIKLPVTDLQFVETLFHDGEQPPVLQVQPDLLLIELQPEQCVLLGNGDFARPENQLRTDDQPALPGTLTPIPLTIERNAQGELQGMLKVDAPGRYVIIGKQLNTGEHEMPLALPKRFGVTFTSGEMGDDGNEQEARDLSLDLSIELENAEGKISPTGRIPDRPMWAGISWLLHHYTLEVGTYQMTIKQRTEPKNRLLGEVFRIS